MLNLFKAQQSVNMFLNSVFGDSPDDPNHHGGQFVASDKIGEVHSSYFRWFYDRMVWWLDALMFVSLLGVYGCLDTCINVLEFGLLNGKSLI